MDPTEQYRAALRRTLELRGLAYEQLGPFIERHRSDAQNPTLYDVINEMAAEIHTCLPRRI